MVTYDKVPNVIVSPSKSTECLHELLLSTIIDYVKLLNNSPATLLFFNTIRNH